MTSKVEDETALLSANGPKLNEILSGRAAKAVDAEKENAPQLAGEQRGAGHGLDLPPISREQDVEASEWSAGAIGSALVRSAVSHDVLQ